MRFSPRKTLAPRERAMGIAGGGDYGKGLRGTLFRTSGIAGQVWADTEMAGTVKSPLSDAPMRSVTSGTLQKYQIRSF